MSVSYTHLGPAGQGGQILSGLLLHGGRGLGRCPQEPDCPHLPAGDHRHHPPVGRAVCGHRIWRGQPETPDHPGPRPGTHRPGPPRLPGDAHRGGQEAGAPLTPCFPRGGPAGAAPVSYTHLDVYKRQAEGWHSEVIVNFGKDMGNETYSMYAAYIYFTGDTYVSVWNEEIQGMINSLSIDG